jgi:hypothetical protein
VILGMADFTFVAAGLKFADFGLKLADNQLLVHLVILS